MRKFQNEQGHDSYEWAGGWLPLVGVTEREACRRAALDVLAVTGLAELPELPTRPSAGMRALDDGGTYYDRARWVVAYLATLAWFGLPYGTRYVPCVITGSIIDAWTADAEHLVPVDHGGRGVVGNLMLADHGANRSKSARPVHPGTLARIVAEIGDMSTIVRGKPSASNPVDMTFKAFARRSPGVMTSTRWEG